MRITFGMIAAKIPTELLFKQPQITNNRQLIERVAPYSQESYSTSPNTLFVASLSSFYDPEAIELPKNVMLILDSPIQFDEKRVCKSNIIYLVETISVADAIELTKNLLLHYCNIANMLMDAFLKGESIQHLVDLCASVILHPIRVVNLGLRVLASSKDYTVSSAMWVDGAATGYISAESFRFSEIKRMISNVMNSSSTFRFVSEYLPKQVQVFPLKSKKGLCFGWLSIVEFNGTPLREDLIGIGEFLTEIVITILENSCSVESLTDNRKNYLLREILDSHSVDFDLCKLTDFPTNGNFCIIVGKSPNNEIVNEKQQRHILELMENNAPCIASIVYRESLVLLCTDKNCDIKRRMFHIHESMGSPKLLFGYSVFSNSLFDIPMLYQQANVAIKLGLQKGGKGICYAFGDLKFENIIQILTDVPDIKFSYNEKVLILKDYDKLNNTDLFITLKEFLQNNLHIKNTAESLFIHRSTLQYRLDRIIDLTNIDFNNPDLLMHINLTYKLLEH